MHRKEEENIREGSKVFHPAASKALKIKQAVMLEPVEPPKVDEAKIDEMVDLTTEVLGEMQSGALSVADKEARGAQLLRQLDMNHFRDCLKRSYLDGPGANIAQAQTTIEEARRQNLARQEAGVKQTKERNLSLHGRTKPGQPSKAMSSPRSQIPRMPWPLMWMEWWKSTRR